MSLSLGIIGLPNVGKSTLFNALVKNGQAQASNYPFCTIEPNLGVVEVPDQRIEVLSAIVNPAKYIPATIEFIDIAGIIKGAAEGEGLGNKFLSHIRESAAILLVARFFENTEVIHVNGKIDPKSDLETVLLELILADLETTKKGIDRYNRASKGGDKQAGEMLLFCQKIFTTLENQNLAGTILTNTDNEKLVLNELQLLTTKPILVIANISEKQLHKTAEELFIEYNLKDLIPNSKWLIPICAKIEAELISLPDKEREDFLSEFGLQESGLTRLIHLSYKLLGLITYFTAGPKEVRAWTISKGWKAPQAAGVIHTDFSKGFIRAEVISYKDYVQYFGELGAKEAGKFRLEGKEYLVEDGDIMHFRFNLSFNS